MGILALKADERVPDLNVTGDSLSVSLKDGHTLRVFLAGYRRLLQATAEQVKSWNVAGGG